MLRHLRNRISRYLNGRPNPPVPTGDVEHDENYAKLQAKIQETQRMADFLERAKWSADRDDIFM